MVFMNHIKSSFASIFKWLVEWKRALPSAKVLNVSPHHSLCHTPYPKRFFEAKVIEGPEAPEDPPRVPLRFHGDRVLFRFLGDRVLLVVLSDRYLSRVLSDMVLFECPVIDFCSGSSVIDSSLGSSVLLFRHFPLFSIKTCYYFFYWKQMFYFILKKEQKERTKRTSHVTISSEKIKKYLIQTRNILLKIYSSISRFINYI